MSSIVLEARTRSLVGKVANRNLRLEGKIPANLYGHEVAQILEMDETPTRRQLLKLTGTHEAVTLRVTDASGKVEEHTVMVQEVQAHPYREEVLHLDFRKLNPARRVKLNVPLSVVGVAPGIKAGGVLQMVVRQVPVICDADNIPAAIEVDVTGMNVKDTKRVLDLNYPANVQPAARQNYSVLGIAGRRQARDGRPEEGAKA